MQRRSAKVQFNQRKGGAQFCNTAAAMQCNVRCTIGQKKDTLYKLVFAYRDTQVCEKKSLLGRIMLGYFSSSDMIWKHRMCEGKTHEYHLRIIALGLKLSEELTFERGSF